MAKKTQSQYEKMTATRIPPLIIRLGIPTIISMLITNLYNMVDTAFVGRLGTSASGAVGIVFGYMAILQAISFLFGQGAGSIMARKMGNQESEAANQTASTGLFCAIVLCIAVAIGSLIFLNPLLRLLGSTETILPYSRTYVLFVLVSAPFISAGFVLNNILRYEGKAFLGMIGLMAGALLNIVGDAILMFGFHMGIAGAGLSTCISQIISFLILISMFVRGKTQSHLSIKNVRIDIGLILDIIGTGLPSLLRQGLTSFAVIILNARAAVYGDAAIAAMSIVSRIIFFVFSVALGLGQGFQPVCSFNYGAKKYSRVREAYRFTLILSQIAIMLLSLATYIKADELVRIFQSDPAVVEIGTRALKLQLISQVTIPLSVMTEMVLQCTGKKVQASWLSSIKSGLFFIPILLIMSAWRGLAGIQEAQPLSNLLVVIPTLWFAILFFKNLPKQDA